MGDSFRSFNQHGNSGSVYNRTFKYKNCKGGEKGNSFGKIQNQGLSGPFYYLSSINNTEYYTVLWTR